jgi:hypothetical protein
VEPRVFQEFSVKVLTNGSRTSQPGPWYLCPSKTKISVLYKHSWLFSLALGKTTVSWSLPHYVFHFSQSLPIQESKLISEDTVVPTREIRIMKWQLADSSEKRVLNKESYWGGPWPTYHEGAPCDGGKGCSLWLRSQKDWFNSIRIHHLWTVLEGSLASF